MATILLIDDEKAILDLVGPALRKAGHDVQTALNGEEGLQRMVSHKIDLVITDVVMPVKEGIETIQLLRRGRPDLPILAISGGGRSGNLDMLQAAEMLGASATLAKPFRVDALVRIVGELLRLPRAAASA